MSTPPATVVDPGTSPRHAFAGWSLGWRITLLLAVALPLLFAAYTHNVWEDYFITLRSARNLVEGHGLVFQPGEHTHTFTSPVGVLVPALCTWMTGPGNEMAALWIFRVLAAAALGGAFVTVINVLRRAPGIGTFGMAVFAGLVLVDAKLLTFSMDGMETAFMILWTALLWAEFNRLAPPRPVRLALLYAALMWTRPDAFVLAGAISFAGCFWRGKGASPTTGGGSAAASPVPATTAGKSQTVTLLRTVAIGIAGGILLYLPWVLWAWWYYGSPIPNTIVAKSILMGHPGILDWIVGPFRLLLGWGRLDYLYDTIYSNFGGWPVAVRWVAHGLTVAALLTWAVPGVAREARRASLALALGSFYLQSIPLFPWYVPAWSILAHLAISGLASRVYDVARNRRPLLAPVRIGAALLVVGQAGICLATAWQLRIQERLIERNVRKAIGLWLHDACKPGETIFLEPLGYIGYYSQAHMLDFPGLSAPSVTHVLKEHYSRGFRVVIDNLHPDWLVLRPVEMQREGLLSPEALKDYRLVRIYSTLDEVRAVPVLPGRGWLEFDATFAVYHKRQPGQVAAAPEEAPSR